MIALSVHSLFEGLAVGIEPQLHEVWSLIIAIAMHKGAAAISLGISLQKNFPTNFRMVFSLALFFALASPIGIIFGIILQSTSPMVNVIFSSLAAGTFIYIACSEVVVEEFSLPGDRFKKYFLFILGALIITALWFFE